jgi:hypothetical protein
MQIGDGPIAWGRVRRPRPSAGGDTAAFTEAFEDDLGAGEAGGRVRRPPAQAEQSESIRDLQRRRRNTERIRADVEALLTAPDDEEDEEDGASPPGPAPGKVFVVFRGAKWDDPDGTLRESDSIAGVYATEAAARRAVAALTKDSGERDDAWYQPYPVQP